MRAVAVAMCLLGLGAAPAAADTLTVTPSSGLTLPGQSVQVVSGGSYSGAVYLVEAAYVGGKTYCNAKYYGPPPATPYAFPATSEIARVSAFTSGDPCKDPAAPGWEGAPATANVPCDPTPPASATCAIEMRNATTGEVLASTPIDFAFPPPTCHDFTTGTGVNSPLFISPSYVCSDPNKRGFTVEILDGPRHGTLGPPDASGQRKYTPENRYVGPDEFTLQAAAGDERSNIATVHIDVRAPSYAGPRSNYFYEYWCGAAGRRALQFAFRPTGGGGPGTPSGFTSVKYPEPFNPLTLADPARPHLSAYFHGSWLAYADPYAFALPAGGKGCSGPAGPVALNPRISAPAKVVRRTDVTCRFRSKFSYFGFYGSRGGGAPPSIRKAVAFEIIVKHGHVKGYRTALTATLAAGHPSLTYDRTTCKH